MTATVDGTAHPVGITERVLNATVPSTSSRQSILPMEYGEGCLAATGNPYCNNDLDLRWKARVVVRRTALDNRVTISEPQPLGRSFGPATLPAEWTKWTKPLLDGNTPQVGVGGLQPMRLSGAKLTSFVPYYLDAGQCGPTCLANWKNHAAGWRFQRSAHCVRLRLAERGNLGRVPDPAR